MPTPTRIRLLTATDHRALLAKAAKVFGNIKDAMRWLNAPQFGLGGATPLVYAETDAGAREVGNLLGRIEHGVYS